MAEGERTAVKPKQSYVLNGEKNESRARDNHQTRRLFFRESCCNEKKKTLEKKTDKFLNTFLLTSLFCCCLGWLALACVYDEICISSHFL